MEWLDGWTTDNCDQCIAQWGFDDFSAYGSPCQVFTFRYADDKSADKSWEIWEKAEAYATAAHGPKAGVLMVGPCAAEWGVSSLGRVLRSRGLMKWANARGAIEAMPANTAQWAVGSGEDIICKAHPETMIASLKALLAVQFSHQVEQGEVAEFLPAANFVFLEDRDVRCVVNNYINAVTT